MQAFIKIKTVYNICGFIGISVRNIVYLHTHTCTETKVESFGECSSEIHGFGYCNTWEGKSRKRSRVREEI